MREERFGHARPLRLLVPAMAYLLCIGLLLSSMADSDGLMVAPPPQNTPASLELSPAMSKDGRRSARITMDLLYASKRRVPKGPDPIHNRRAGKSWRPPGKA